MGIYWLHSAVTPLKNALGSKFKLYPGYATRSRTVTASRPGGFTGIWGIVMHHDADPPSGSDDAVIKYEYENAVDKPIGNFHVQRDGDVWFGAAGASNHAGKGGPVPTSRGTIPLNGGNSYLIGIEASNNGIGEVWNSTQMNSYLTLVTVLCQTFRLDPLLDIYGHWTWCQPSCPGRKIDPRGPTPSYPKFGGTSGTNKWNMQEVRKEVNARIKTTIPPKPTPIPPSGEFVNFQASAATAASIKDAPGVADTVANKYNDWFVIAALKCIQKQNGLTINGQYNQQTAEVIDRTIAT